MIYLQLQYYCESCVKNGIIDKMRGFQDEKKTKWYYILNECPSNVIRGFVLG